MKNTIDLRGINLIERHAMNANRERNANRAAIAVFAILFALGIGYLFYLNAGCGAPLHTGIMTWHGKTCLQ
jgi:hypothetical protein